MRALPRGGTLPAENWRRRHLALTLVLLWHFPLLLAFGLVQTFPLWHVLVDSSVPLVFGSLALCPLSRSVRSMAVAVGLIGCSGVLVHLSHGLIEAHFHFFVIVALLTLYQDWKPFLLAIGLTVFEHGVMGVVAPHSVYDHADAWAHPWKWAVIHGTFIAAASAAGITSWSMSEADRRRMEAETSRLHAERVDALAHAAYHDQLTGLPNRRMVLEHLSSALGRVGGVGVLFLDLDGFKQINDTYGHLTGDAVLIEVAARLRAAVRGGDLAARLGGDEFVVVYEGPSVSSRIEAILAEPIVLGDGLTLHVGASVGYVRASGDEAPAALIDRADREMYKVKRTRHVDLREERRGVIPGPR